MVNHRRSFYGSRPVVFAATILSFTLLGAILYLAQAVLMPFAVAVLLTFLLSPVVSRLERLRAGRVASVILSVLLAGSFVGGLAWLVGSQLNSLTHDLPRYQDTVRQKVADLRHGASLEKLGATLEGFLAEEPESTRAHPGAPPAPGPLVVRMVQDKDAGKMVGSALGSLVAASPAVKALGTAGLALVLLIFMLLKREDLRNRLVSFTSSGSLTATTRALDDAGQRISRYLLRQLIVNGSFGLAVGLGLLAIRVHYALLWGLLAAVLRYIPYIGGGIAALLPLAVTFLTSAGWTQLLLVLALFLVLDLLTSNVVEPWLYGRGIGISEVALLVAAAFWAWIWGPVGLILATPITVCVVVLGRHVPSMAFLDRLLGDRPALAPFATYLQRLLARDGAEAKVIVDEYRRVEDPRTVYDAVFVPALKLARRDRLRSIMTAEDEDFILQQTRGIIDGLDVTAQCGRGRAGALPGPPSAPSTGPVGVRVLGCPAHHEADELTLHMVDRLLAPAGVRVEVLSTRALPSEIVAQVARERPALVLIAALPPGGLLQARYLCRRLRKAHPDLGIVVAYPGYRANLDRLIQRLRAAGADRVTTTLAGARRSILSLIRGGPSSLASAAAALPPAFP